MNVRNCEYTFHEIFLCKNMSIIYIHEQKFQGQMPHSNNLQVFYSASEMFLETKGNFNFPRVKSSYP